MRNFRGIEAELSRFVGPVMAGVNEWMGSGDDSILMHEGGGVGDAMGSMSAVN